jgi:hypothetical protein
MDPYLEGPLWPDVHQALASEIRSRLTPRIRPNYVARLAVRVVKVDEPEAEIGVMYPDIEVLYSRRGRRTPPAERAPAETWAGMTPAPLSLTSYPSVEYRLVTIEVRAVTGHRLVTAIELISPVNKRGDGLTDYRRKRARLRAAGVNLVEIDLLRRGTRPVVHPELPPCDYLIALTRRRALKIDVWPLSIRDALPVVPIPLRRDDGAVPLDLGAALNSVYDAAAYESDLDYSDTPPPPELSPEDAAWVREITQRMR